MLLYELISRLRLAWLLFIDQRVPLWVKGIPLLSLLYIVSPIDFLPDLMPAMGQLDDVGIMLLGLTLFVKLCPPTLVESYQRDLENNRNDIVDATYRVMNDKSES